MSEERVPTASFTKRIAHFHGKKTTQSSMKIELFRASCFARKWAPDSRKFFPKPPLYGNARDKYWRTRYRVRINGKWVITLAKYTMFTKDQIFDQWLDF